MNEVGCRGDDFVEVVNVGVEPFDMARVTVRRAAAAIPWGTGPLPVGERALFRPAASGFGYACGVEKVKLAIDGLLLPQVDLPHLPQDASYARIPDALGAFGPATPTPGAANLAYLDEAARLFDTLDEPVPASPPRLDLALSPSDEAALRANGHVYVRVDVTFTDAAGSTTAPGAGIRIKGQSVRRTLDQKAAFRLDFDRFAPGGHLFGLEKLVLNNLVQDNSASRERVFYGLFARRGLPVSRFGYVAVYVNAVYFGVYVALEAQNDPGFLGRELPSTAATYEGEYGQDLFVGNEGFFDQDFGVPDGGALLAPITQSLEAARPDTILEHTMAFIDWEQVTRNMAADMLCGHWDSYTATRNNFTLHVSNAGRLRLLSGGADQSFDPDRTHPLPFREGQGHLLRRCVEDGDCAAGYDLAVLDTAVDFAAWLDTTGPTGLTGRQRLAADALTLEALFETDPRREWDNHQIPTLVDDIVSYLDERTAAALAP
ncbi:MAG: hypothetical protein FJ137_23525 [Deltaproteobacteria bacterium]|nr:hypothetical protein [Deltaproteobacteria bacterium]